MTTLKGVVRNGRIELKAPNGLPDGTEVLVDVLPLAPETVGLDEAEWRNDPEALAEWGAWLTTIEPVELTPAERAARERFDEEFHRFNIEAVREAMRQGADE